MAIHPILLAGDRLNKVFGHVNGDLTGRCRKHIDPKVKRHALGRDRHPARLLSAVLIESVIIGRLLTIPVHQRPEQMVGQ